MNSDIIQYASKPDRFVYQNQTSYKSRKKCTMISDLINWDQCNTNTIKVVGRGP